ncbi:hypothetical protein [Roseovarius sp. ZX-A-9]|uniref:hypothetical protein n=1 Tax=Roseovarius sp. ZX-A-9 TaxID=3014783 RepID=UPI00232A7BB0|nr:hypothetical protein [Roseovarius sp. ZX-A-9]
MSKIDRYKISDHAMGSQPADVERGPNLAPIQITFEQSIQAYELAVQSNSLYSFKDLVLSGTWKKYEQRAASMARKDPSGDPFISYLSIDHANGWTSANSRQSYRSALVRMAAQKVLEKAPAYWCQVFTDERNESTKKHYVKLLKPHRSKDLIDRLENVKGRLTVDQRSQFISAVAFLLQVPPDPHHRALRDRSTKERGKAKTRARSSKSKKDALYALNRHQRRKAKTLPNYDWRSHFWATAVIPDRYLDDRQRAFIATFMLTGCRPAEFSDDFGVTVHAMDTNGQSSLSFEIAGAKVSEEKGEHSGRGQCWRKIDLFCQTDEAIWLFDYISEQRQKPIVLTLSAATHKKSGEALMPLERGRRVSSSLGKLTTRLGKIAFPRLRQTLTPYVFRHAIASDLKAGGHEVDRLDISAILGQQSARTQENYGSANTARNLAGSRAPQIIDARSFTPVRQPERLNYLPASKTQADRYNQPGAHRLF